LQEIVTADARLVRNLLRAVRKLRVGEGASLGPVPVGLADDLDSGGRLTLAGLCRSLSSQLDAHVGDPRAVDACVRFYGLGRMPESLEVIAASLPSAADNTVSLRVRRVKQLITEAELQLGQCLKSNSTREVQLLSDDDIDLSSIGNSSSECDSMNILLRAWADIPDSDQRSATALLLFEQEACLRPVLITGLHREDRRRLRRRSRAIVGMAVGRQRLVDRAPAEHPVRGWRPDLAAELLLGPRHQVTETSPGALDSLLRTDLLDRRIDPDVLVAACASVRDLVQTGHRGAASLLGVLRCAVARSAERVPALVVVRTLSMTTIVARENDDPVGVVAAGEACRLARSALTEAPRDRDVGGIVCSTVRALQELAELQARLDNMAMARSALCRGYTLLREHGDPEADEEPDGWLQQLAYTSSLIERRAAALDGDRPARLAAAYGAAKLAVSLVDRHPELPVDRGLTAGSVLGQVAVDLAVPVAQAVRRATDPLVRRARALVEVNEQRWLAHGPASVLTARSARLLAVVNACRLALLEHDHDEYRRQRGRTARLVGAWMQQADVQELRDLERSAEAAGIAGLGLSATAPSGPDRIGQRSWAARAPTPGQPGA
jgi:hypothetical protein